MCVITMEDEKERLCKYAESFSRLPIIGTRYLTFRDVPGLVEKYVRGFKTLDYGCGPGHSTAMLKSLGLDVDGVDTNEDMIRLSRKLDPDGTYSTIKSAQIERPKGQYDLVYAGYVLNNVSSKNELFHITTEVSRVLKSQGIFIAATTNKNTYTHKWLIEDTDFEENKNLVSGAVAKIKMQHLTMRNYYWSDDDYREVISGGGLDLLCVHDLYGKDSDGFPWINEKNVSSATIYVAKKL